MCIVQLRLFRSWMFHSTFHFSLRNLMEFYGEVEVFLWSWSLLYCEAALKNRNLNMLTIYCVDRWFIFPSSSWLYFVSRLMAVNLIENTSKCHHWLYRCSFLSSSFLMLHFHGFMEGFQLMSLRFFLMIFSAEIFIFVFREHSDYGSKLVVMRWKCCDLFFQTNALHSPGHWLATDLTANAVHFGGALPASSPAQSCHRSAQYLRHALPSACRLLLVQPGTGKPHRADDEDCQRGPVTSFGLQFQEERKGAAVTLMRGRGRSNFFETTGGEWHWIPMEFFFTFLHLKRFRCFTGRLIDEVAHSSIDRLVDWLNEWFSSV